MCSVRTKQSMTGLLRMKASLPKRLFFSRPITLNFFLFFYPLKDAVFPNTILVGDALAGEWFDVEKYFNEFQKRLNSTGNPNKID